jgi:hypothetical protein
MALRTARFRPGRRPERRRVRQTGGFTGLVVLIGLGAALPMALGGCGAVETYRALAGVDKNDPDPQTAPFSGNLADAESAPYPNLASFPPMPVRATNTAERLKLTQSLIADRSALAADSGLAAEGSAEGAKAAPGVPAAALATAAGAPPNVQSANPAAPAALPGASPPARSALNSAQSGRRATGEPPEPGPLDSSLEMPDVRSVPEPEATRPPPPAPALAAVPRPALVPAPAPAAVASAMPQPAPPVPELAPVAPPPAAARTEPKRAPAATTVATLELSAAAAPVGQDRAQIDRVAMLYKDNPGAVRVLAYAAAPKGGGDPLDSYHAALERAQAVAKALADAGIPAGKIQTQAAPAAGARATGRVEIQFTP